jgi:hypothetical protein
MASSSSLQPSLEQVIKAISEMARLQQNYINEIAKVVQELSRQAIALGQQYTQQINQLNLQRTRAITINPSSMYSINLETARQFNLLGRNFINQVDFIFQKTASECNRIGARYTSGYDTSLAKREG